MELWHGPSKLRLQQTKTRNDLEMPVSGVDLQPVLHGTGCDPDVVCGGGGALLSKLVEHRSIDVCSFLVDRPGHDSGGDKECIELLPVFSFRPASIKT